MNNTEKLILMTQAINLKLNVLLAKQNSIQLACYPQIFHALELILTKTCPEQSEEVDFSKPMSNLTNQTSKIEASLNNIVSDIDKLNEFIDSLDKDSDNLSDFKF